jgi:hypothetical protein
MTANTGWEQRSWGGANGLREERSRARHRLEWAALVCVLFVYCLLQVRMSTEVAAVSSRINHRQAEVKRLEVDLAVAQAKLARRQIFGELIRPSEAEGFGPGGQYRTISLIQTAAAEPIGVWQQLGGELQRGAELILPAALAQDVLASDRGRSDRPQGRIRADRPGDRSRAIRP